MTAHNTAKPGNPEDRKAAADFARSQRARFPSLAGGWTYHEWCCHQVAQAAQNKLAILTAARRSSISRAVDQRRGAM